MCLLAFEPIRRVKYEIFLIFHYLYIPVVVFLALHVKSTLFGFIPGLFLHAIDHACKLYAIWSADCVVDALVHEGENNDFITLTLKVSANEIQTAQRRGGGCYYFLHVPGVSWFQWHPFSIAEMNRETSTITFHIKALGKGSFTRKLLELVRSTPRSSLGQQDGSKSSSHSGIRVARYGVFGSLSVDLSRYEHVVFVAGGVGITPIANILHAVSNTDSNDRRFSQLRSLSLYWVARGRDVFTALECALPFISPDHHVRENNGTNVPSANYRSSIPLNKIRPMESPSMEVSTVNGYRAVELGHQAPLHVSYCLYDTQKTPIGQVKSVNYAADYGSAPDAVRLHQSVSYGGRIVNINMPAIVTGHRPDLADIMTHVTKTHETSSTCVVVCGPDALSTETCLLCNHFKIDYHVETFGY
jgi:hypothetical protein